MLNVIFTFILLVFSSLLNADGGSKAEELIDKFHVCTVCTRLQRNLEKLLSSAKACGIDVTVLGMDKPYYGNGTKFTYTREYLETLPDEDILLFVDAFDVLIIGDKKRILEKFLSFKAPLVMGAETHCYPGEYKTQYPTINSPWKYINTGTYIGYVHQIKKWLDDMKPVSERCDQRQTQEHYFAKPQNKSFFVLDTQCKIFLPLFRVKEEQVAILTEAKKVKCVPNNTHPCIIHANGKSFSIWTKIYNELVAQGS